MRQQFCSKRKPGIYHSRMISEKHSSRLVSELRRRAVSSLTRKSGSQPTMRQDMQSCSICFRMWDLYTRFRSSRQEQAQQVTPCRCRRRMRCSTPRARCFRISWYPWRTCRGGTFLTISQQVHPGYQAGYKAAREMVTKYGMSENIGLICYDDDDDEVFIGRDLAHAQSYSEGGIGNRCRK